MKGAFSLFLPAPPCLCVLREVKGGVPRVARLSTAETVRQLLSGSLTHAYEVSLPLHAFTPDVTASASCFPSYFSVSCYPPKMMSLLLCSLRYLALRCLRLRLRLILRSASAPLSLISLSRYRYCPPPHAYSKMFVGGLSWDTTDGTLSLAHLIPFAMSCPFY
jgi:uncharacterized membrane protein YhdT